MKTTAFTTLAALILATHANAALVITAPTDSASGSLEITDDITFNVLTTGQVFFITLDNYVTHDGTSTFSSLTPNLAFRINSNSPSTSLSSFMDNATSTSNDLTPNDGGIFLLDVPMVFAGNSFTLIAATYSLAPTSGFNPLSTQNFTGDLFLSDPGNIRISNIVTVPETSSSALLSLAALSFLSRRRRKN